VMLPPSLPACYILHTILHVSAVDIRAIVVPALLYRPLMCKGRHLSSSAESSNISVLSAEGSCKLLGRLQPLFSVRREV
jgi:hypothetical protein